MEKIVTVSVPSSVISSITGRDDDGSQWAWPHGSGAISSLRSLVRDGHAEETTGECDGCDAHRSGTTVPVFRIFPGVKLTAS